MTALRRASVPALLAALTLVTWAGVLRVPFQFDDYPTIVLDPATRDAAELWWRLSHGVRPLLRVSFYLDHAMWGTDAAGFHATNLALHVATVLGVFALARRRLGGDLAAFVASALFAVQPAHAEVIAYVSGRSTGLMTALLVAALVAHERVRDAAGRRRVAWHLASAALAAAACFAKEVAVIFPALLAAWELTRSDAAPRPRWLRRAAVALALAAGIVAVLALSPRYRFLFSYSLELRDPLESLRVNLAAVPAMLSLWVRPWALSVDHGFDPAGAGAVPGALLLAGAVLLAAGARRRAPLLTLAIAWTLLALAPTSSLIAKLDPVTEKPLYLAWIGPSLALGALAAWRPAGLACAVAAALLVAGGLASAARVAVWQDPRALWADAAAKAPQNARAWNNLGMAHTLADDHHRARAAFVTALRLDPDDVAARQNLARLDDSWDL